MKIEDKQIIYEKGDYVTVINSNGKNYIGNTYIFIEYTGGSMKVSDEDNLPTYFESNLDTLRPASQEEMDTFGKVSKIGHYAVKYNDDDSVTIGCVTLTRDMFHTIVKKAGWL